MRKFLQWLLKKPISRFAEKISSAPDRDQVFKSLSHLLKCISAHRKNKGLFKLFDSQKDKIIIFSDQHKGARDGADDFEPAEKNYLAALSYYHENGFLFISLGDCEELWKNTPEKVMKSNGACFEAEKKFEEKEHYIRVFGNHDLEWKYKLQQNIFLRPVFGEKLKVYEGLLLKTSYRDEPHFIFLAHGHQGDKRSDGNLFSAWVVANIWTPIQRYLQIRINTPSTSFTLSDKHNIMMHDWSSTQKNLIFISGHTHKPVFASMDHIDRLTAALQQMRKTNDTKAIASIQQELEKRRSEYAGKEDVKTKTKPCYFNSGCCCFNDGDITGIEISDGDIRLIKWNNKTGTPERQILEQSELSYVFEQLHKVND
jgi:predicted phosphodiesterase